MALKKISDLYADNPLVSSDLDGTELAELVDKDGVSGAITYEAKKDYFTANSAKVAKVNLSSAEILALFITPKTLVAAPGAGKFIRPLSFMFVVTGVATPYATNTQLVAKVGSLAAFVTNTSALPAAADHTAIAAAGASTLTGAADYANAPLTLSTNGGNPTAGDGIISVYVTYQIINL